MAVDASTRAESLGRICAAGPQPAVLAAEPGLPVLVADAMLHHPKVWPADVTVDDLRKAFDDDHVHAALIVDGESLVAVVTRTDLAERRGTEPALRYGRLQQRVISPGADLSRVWARMTRERTRRLAVVDHDHTLLGLLCLKRSGRGFCSDADVAARAAERRGVGGGDGVAGVASSRREAVGP